MMFDILTAEDWDFIADLENESEKKIALDNCCEFDIADKITELQKELNLTTK